ncbi:MAG: sigma-54 dependent transcriptional regulator [Calditrichia bacterium]
MMNGKILLVEDDLHTLEGLADILEEEQFTVVKAREGREALQEMNSNNFNVLLIDYLLPDMDGLEVSEQVLREHPEVKIIMMTAFGSVKNAVHAMKMGIYDYLTKPVNLDELLIIIRRALEEQRLIFENIDLKDKLQQTYSFENIIGVSGKMQEVFRKVAKVSATEATVLIRGESGTGKELIARAIHFQSKQKDRPLIEINCASIPETLLESELFGHEKGAFTGAYKSKKGKFELADSGTLFLDEIGELPLGVQAKLLRVLQEQTFTRVGGIENIKVKVRLIAATNSNLEKALEEKRFREDLYYRLNVIPIFIPPLRERLEDIGPLVDFFIKKYAVKNNRPIKGITQEARDLLMQYHWPGNVRELENALENAVVMAESDYIQVADLPGYLQGNHRKSVTLMGSLLNKPELTYRERLNQFEREIIRQALEASEGNKTQAAKKLGFTLRTLRNKIQKYNL